MSYIYSLFRGINVFMKKIRVVLADDHAIVRAGIRKIVEEFPNLEIVAEVQDGPTLLGSLARTRPSCLLVDLNMPNFDPLQAIPAIRDKYRELKILVISVHNDPYYVKALLEAGIDGYHLKDQPLSDLKLAMERILNGKRWISSPLFSKLFNAQQAADSPKLTDRQQDVLRFLQEGLDNRNIALELDLSIKTIENHLTSLYRKLNIGSRLEAVNYLNQHPELLGEPRAQIPQGKSITLPKSHEVAILLVDDNQRYLNQLQRVLRKIAHKACLYPADNINSAVHLAKHIQPQLALVDVVLGEEDGISCTRQIKKVSKSSRVVMISAYPDREFHRLGIEAGAVAFLDKKDLDTPTLQKVIEDLI